MKDSVRLPRTPRHVRHVIAFYHMPQRYAHASWPEAVLTSLASMTDCPDPPPPPDAPILVCLDPRRIARFVAVLDCMLGCVDADAHGDVGMRARADTAADARACTGTDAGSVLSAEERALARASAPLLYPPGDEPPGDEPPGDEPPGDSSRNGGPPGMSALRPARVADVSARTGAGYLSRYYATQAPAIAARLRLLLPCDGAPCSHPAEGRVPTAGVVHGCARRARAEQRFLERAWNWGARQCFW
ncbi:MAG: hypothetical protein ACRYHA_33800 [Janthinobacterium lividum]